MTVVAGKQALAAAAHRLNHYTSLALGMHTACLQPQDLSGGYRQADSPGP